MKNKLLSLLAIVIATSAASSISVAGQNGRSGARPFAQKTQITQTAPLNAEDTASLLWMREEEKLARDIYRRLYDQWRDPIFLNIAKSEQRHFDAVGTMVSNYQLTDPASLFEGQFAQAELQELYFTLLNSGTVTLVSALTVGASIEDLDIRDLQEAIDATTNPALKVMYGKLLEGSKNHLRAFASRLQSMGVEYTPQYIDAVSYDAIVGL
jgi:hypothetical protein